MENMTLQQESVDSHEKLTEALLHYAKEQGEFTQVLDVLLSGFYRHVSIHELSHYSLSHLYERVLMSAKTLEKRKANQVKIELVSASSQQLFAHNKTFVNVVLDDMPFIVDSIRAELARLGYAIVLTINLGGASVNRLRSKAVDISLDRQILDFSHQEAIVQMELDHVVSDDEIRSISSQLLRVLDQVKCVVKSWPSMKNYANCLVDYVSSYERSPAHQSRDESIAFLRWLIHDHFTFLGTKTYSLNNKGAIEGPFGDNGYGLLSEHYTHAIKDELPVMLEELSALSLDFVSVHKTKADVSVHRPGKMDLVIVQWLDQDGVLLGMHCFLGLLTSTVYQSRPKDIPLLRQKNAKIIENSGFFPKSHTGKALIHLLDTLPRDELFLSSLEDLQYLALGLLHLQDRHMVRLFVRGNCLNQSYACLVLMPKDVYNTDLVAQIRQELLQFFESDDMHCDMDFACSGTVRLYWMITLKDSMAFSKAQVMLLEQTIITLCRSWRASLRTALIENHQDYGAALALYERYAHAFSAGYRDLFSAHSAAIDIKYLETLSRDDDVAIQFYHTAQDEPGMVCLKMYSFGQSVLLYEVMPILENMGLRVIGEQPYQMTMPSNKPTWVNFFTMQVIQKDLSLEIACHRLEEAFKQVWLEQCANDHFNQLILLAEMSSSQLMILRSYTSYLRQLGFPFSMDYMAEALCAYPVIAKALTHYFEKRFKPEISGKRHLKTLEKQLAQKFESVQSLDHDRIFRGILSVMSASLRTNYFRRLEIKGFCDYFSMKVAVRELVDFVISEPRPMFDTFVKSSLYHFEGIHLRDSKVARGGLRLSDRREDFRTEVAGLQFAQQQKNALIVPSGAKGAFVLVDTPVWSSRSEEMAAIIEAYQHFNRGLLDITDNLVGDDTIQSPPGVVCYDDYDHYLVVAADKGTATFSDIANDIAKEYGFWLGDAYASGGATGYDHKGMGITAKGAWASVQHHFQQLGINVQDQSISVVGIGDMGGDVFGNGMLMSSQIKLIAAFNHRHIFLDPHPDPEASYKERMRLFKSESCSWEDYSEKQISPGGGVFSRQAKSIPLSPEVRECLGIEKDSMVPNELIKVCLKAEVDLIWNGGIGTFVRSAKESDQDAMDAANNPIRVEASALRAKAFVEGGNLGLTQKARIEYALQGGIINTDFIDNSAGVDCSDREVNLKILLNQLLGSENMTMTKRNELLAKMTDEVSQLVLTNNKRQNRAISLAVDESLKYINLYQRYMHEQEQVDGFSRDILCLPSDKELLDRKSQNRGLTRPELAVLMAHAKNQLKDYLSHSSLSAKPYFLNFVEHVFPRMISSRFRDALDQHRLKKAIVVTKLANDVIDDMGVTFIHQMQDETGASVNEIVVAYAVAKAVYDMDKLMLEIDLLNFTISSKVQAEMRHYVIRLVRRAARWIIRSRHNIQSVSDSIDEFSKEVRSLSKKITSYLTGISKKQFLVTESRLIESHVPHATATRIAALAPSYALLNIIEASMSCQKPLAMVASVYYALQDVLKLDLMRERINEFPVDDRWAVLARAKVKGDLDVFQRILTICVLQKDQSQKFSDKKIEAWLEINQSRVDRWLLAVQNLYNTDKHDFAMLSVMNQELSTLARSSVSVDYGDE